MAYTATAGANSVALRYVKETVPGTTPTTPQTQAIAFSSEGFDVTTTSTSSTTIRADRNIADSTTTEVNATGALGFNLSASAEFEELLLAMLCRSAWTADTVVNGVDRTSFTFEKQFTDLTNKFMIFTGSQLNTFDLTLATGTAGVGCNFGFMVFGGVDATATLDVSPTAASTAPEFSTVTDLSSFKINGVEYPDGLTNFTMNLTNNMRAQRKIGSKFLAGIGLGSFAASGTGQAFFQDATSLQDAANNEVLIPLEFTLIRAGSSYRVQFPKCKISAVTRVTSGINTDVELSFTWTAIFDSGIGGTIKVTRVHP